MYISYVNIRSLTQQEILEAPIKGVRDEAEEDEFFSQHSSWNHRSRLQEEPLYTTPWASSCPVTARYRLTPQQSIPTTASSTVVREPQRGRVWQFLGTRTI